VSGVNIMSGKNNGAQALIQNDQPLEFYTHCFSHSLNLCLSKAYNLSNIANINKKTRSDRIWSSTTIFKNLTYAITIIIIRMDNMKMYSIFHYFFHIFYVYFISKKYTVSNLVLWHFSVVILSLSIFGVGLW